MNCLNHTVKAGLAPRGWQELTTPLEVSAWTRHMLCPHTSAAALLTELRALGGGCLFPTQDHRAGLGGREGHATPGTVMQPASVPQILCCLGLRL